MQRHPEQTRRRLAQTAARLRSLAYPGAVAPDHLEVSREATDRIDWDAAQQLEYRPAALGEIFGPLFATYWFRVEATIPEAWAGRRVDLIWDSGSEATLWQGGQPVQGLYAGWQASRTHAPVIDSAHGGECVALAVELAANSWAGDVPPLPPGADPVEWARWRRGRTWEEPRRRKAPVAPAEPARLQRCELALFDPEAWALAWDFEVLRQLELEHARGLDFAWAGELLAELNRFCNVWQARERSTWPIARELLTALLDRHGPSPRHRVIAVGHAHLDTAWLWPLAEGRRKAVRTFANQVALMERYPEHRFAASAAQHYAWVEADAPTLAAKVRKRVRDGRWIVVGGAWVEPDCNLPSGESLVRQLLHGQRFFEKRFGRRCREYWSPDTFGHNGQMPQILRQAGIDRFMTHKLSWNQFSTPSHHSFRWQGIDGSEVLAHMPPADTANSPLTIAEVRRGAAKFRDHDRSATSLLPFGHGDGGGGPTPEMLEVAMRVADLEGVPEVELGSSDEFFDRLASELSDPPTVVGELYLEYHRGTYTSQAATKRANRRGERALHDAEAAAAIAARLGLATYPAQRLETLWQTLLVHQFHDILPGSSIRLVHEEAERALAKLLSEADGLRDAALLALGKSNVGRAPVNLAPFARLEVVRSPTGEAVAIRAPAYGFGAGVAAEDAVSVQPDGELIVLQNGQLRATLDRRGRLISLIERDSDRESLAEPGNRFELYEDLPTAFDAWEIEPYHLETREECPGAERCEVLSEGPLRAELAFAHAIGTGSTLRQVVRLDAQARRLEFRTTVDWAERHRLLKVLFPTLVRADSATYEMQFGVQRRPTHFNTPADLARFEVPGHRFVDLSEHRFGVALLTDSTYGYSTHGNEMRLSLLRGPTDPDPEADLGMHELGYAILPHRGGWQEAGVVAEARRFNCPITWADRGRASTAFAEVDDGNLVLDTIKRAEDDDDLVLRLYEAHGGRGVAGVRVAVPFARPRIANALEEPGDALAVEGDRILVPYRPFQLLTLRLG
jgi:alpha-mannosidase